MHQLFSVSYPELRLISWVLITNRKSYPFWAAFTASCFSRFKFYCAHFVCVHLKKEFPTAVSDKRFIKLSYRCAEFSFSSFVIFLSK